MTATTTQLADILKITTRHIYNLENAGVLKKIDKDCWDISANVHSYLYYKIEAESAQSDLGKVKIRRELADAKLKELLYKEKIGSLISLENVAKELEDIAIVISNRLYALPSMLKAKYGIDAELKNALEYEIENILKELKDPEIYIKEGEKVAAKIEAEKKLEAMANAEIEATTT